MLLLLHETFGIYAFVLNYEQENVQFDQSDIQQTAYLYTCNLQILWSAFSVYMADSRRIIYEHTGI